MRSLIIPNQTHLAIQDTSSRPQMIVMNMMVIFPIPFARRSNKSDGEIDEDPAPEVIAVSDNNKSDNDENTNNDDEPMNVEAPEEDAEAQLSTYYNLFIISIVEEKLIISSVERLSKDWNAPIYVFFRKVPRIEYVNDRRAHVFECAAGRCRGKNGRDVRRFLDTGDAKSTSGLRRHAKNCWGDEAVAAADGTQDLESARVVLAKTKLRDGSITAEFERIGKGKLTYSHRQHTSTESR